MTLPPLTRPPIRSQLVALLAAICVVAGACQAAGSPAGSGSPSAGLLLRVTNEGGFINPTGSLSTLPAVSVYSDGQIMTPAPQAAIYPGPLVPTTQVRSVGPDGARRIEAAINAAGLETAGGSTGPGNPDAGQTVFTVIVDGSPVVSRFDALGAGVPGGAPGPGSGTGGGNAAAAFDLLNRIQDPTDTWGAGSVTTWIYRPTAYRIFVAPGAPAADPSLKEPAIDWPLSTPLSAFGTPAAPDRGIAGLRSGVVTGPDAAILGPVLARATAITPFMSAGQAFTLYARPLLPDEAP